MTNFVTVPDHARAYERMREESQAKRIADLEEALEEAISAWGSYLNMMPSKRGRERLDEVRDLLRKSDN